MTPRDAAYVAEVVDDAPPLTPEQCARLAAVIRSVQQETRQLGREAA